MKKIFLILPILFLLTGCYNYRELNDLAIVSGISITKEENTYKVTAEVVNPKKQQDTSSSKEPDFIIYTSSANSMQEAFRKVIKESPRKLYLAQMDILIIDEKVAEEELNTILDFIARDPEVRSEFYVLIGKIDKILEVTTPLENISSKNILESLKANNMYLGYANLITYHELINDYLNPNIEIALPSIEVTGNPKEGEDIKNIESTTEDASSVISNIGVFKNNKLLGYLSEKESLVYNLVMGNTQTTLIKTNYQNNQYVVNEIIDSSVKTEADPKNNKITISIKGKSAISEVNYDCDLEKIKTIEDIQKKLNETIEDTIKNSIEDTILKYNSDIYGFLDLFYKKDPKYYKTIKDEWYEKIFPNLEIEVKSKIEIIEKGNLNGGLYHE